MNRISIPVEEVLVQDRQRPLDEAHVKSLADSIKEYGLVQPIVINQNKRLIAGGHRLAAHKKLGLTHIDVVYKETLSEDQLQELELTENVKRKDLDWQHICISIAKIHHLKSRTSALASKRWGERETGNLINVNQAQVHYALVVAKELWADKTESNEFWKATNFNEAYEIIMRKQQEEAESHLATVQNNIIVEEFEGVFPIVEEEIDMTKTQVNIFAEPAATYEAAKEKYLANPLNPPDEFDAYWQEKQDRENNQRNKVILSNRFFKVDSIEFMNNNPERFDSIITDIPYAIDIDHLDQHVGIANIDTIREEHTVEGNLELFRLFFPAAFNTLKENAFMCVWCDAWHFRYIADLAMESGFKVQRWPVTWVKTYPCLNQMAQYNWTKSTEICLICRKGNITLPEKQPNCVIMAARDELCEKIGHPFAKPYACWQRLIEAVTIKGQTILEPFMGRGSSILSAMDLERIPFGCEINEQHFNAGLENIKGWYLQKNQNSIFI